MKNSTFLVQLNSGRNFLKWPLSKGRFDNFIQNGSPLKISNCFSRNRALLYFDMDCHTGENPNQIKLLMDEYRQRYAPNMPKPVINERGGSAWLPVILLYQDLGLAMRRISSNEFNRIVDGHSQVLKNLADELGIKLSEVKVYGRMYDVTWEKDFRGKCFATKVKAGDLYKCPPSEVWLDQPAINARDLVTAAKPLTSSPLRGKPCHNQSASYSPQYLKPEQLERMPQLMRHIRNQWLDRPRVDGRGRKISDRAFAEVVSTIWCLPDNKEGHNPRIRHERFINCLEELGDFEYRFDAHRFKAVRDYLSSIGAINWENNEYDFVAKIACKWGLVDEFKEVIAGIVNLNSLSLPSVAKVWVGEYKVPQLKRLMLPIGWESRLNAIIQPLKLAG
jgi:hypothetical protein